MEHSPQFSTLAGHLLDIQKQLQPVLKDALNPFTNSTYATLNSVMEACHGELLSRGILLTQLPCAAPVELGAGYIGLETRIIHAESEEWISSTAVIPLPKNDPQGMGSAITYSRRYTLCSILGIVTEDDDGNAASNLPTKQVESRKRPIAGSSLKNAPNRDVGVKKKFSDTPNRPVANPPSLPKIDGVGFKSISAEDGRLCIVATGRTMEKKELLKASGFKWDSQQKIWWKYAETA